MPALLIAGYAGRALASAARRAGLRPLVVDAFGDRDTRQTAEHLVTLPQAVTNGFRGRDIFPALAELTRGLDSPPIGIVLGSGFEETPGLIASITKRYRLFGSSAESVRRAKSPRDLAALTSRFGVDFPETCLTPPDQARDWLTKRRGGSGGMHIRDGVIAKARRGYFQRRVDGEPLSILVVAHGTDREPSMIGFSRQWTAPSLKRPYRYGGAIGPIDPKPLIANKMRHAAVCLSDELNLLGLASFDFLVADETVTLVDINPRPGATLDIFDDADGTLLRAHIDASISPLPMPGQVITLKGQREQIRAAALLYADQGPLTVGDIDWPDWASDQPMPQTHIPSGAPLATVHASGETPDDAMRRARARLEALSDLLYGPP